MKPMKYVITIEKRQFGSDVMFVCGDDKFGTWWGNITDSILIFDTVEEAKDAYDYHKSELYKSAMRIKRPFYDCDLSLMTNTVRVQGITWDLWDKGKLTNLEDTND